jgi:type II secretory pathway pseudopilin PulG
MSPPLLGSFGGRGRRILEWKLDNGSTHETPKGDANLILVGSPRRGDLGRLGEPSLPPMKLAWSKLDLRPPSGFGAVRPVKKSHSERGFTMIEIAIAIGVIGFALVAIIGILPKGMNVQKDNRENTIISQDAPYFLNAIRNGEMRTTNNILTGYVESIAITNMSSTGTNGNVYNNPSFGSGTYNYLTNDMTIIGLLSTPEYDSRIPGVTNQVTAVVTAMTGSAVQQDGANSLMAFTYQLTVEIDPWNFSAAYTPNYITSPEPAYMNFMGSMLHEVRLKFAWPVLPTGSLGPGRQTYRSLISSHLGWSNMFSPDLWYFQPLVYTTNIMGP